MNVKIGLKSASDPIEYPNAESTYEKGSFHTTDFEYDIKRAGEVSRKLNKQPIE